jgi:hypothetical protein
MLSEAYRGDTMKVSSVFGWHKWFKEGHKNMIKEVVIQNLTELMKMLKKCRIRCIQTLKHQSYGCATDFSQRKIYMGRRRPELWPNNWILHHDDAPAHKALLSSSFWHKNQLLKLDTHPIPLV